MINANYLINKNHVNRGGNIVKSQKWHCKHFKSWPETDIPLLYKIHRKDFIMQVTNLWLKYGSEDQETGAIVSAPENAHKKIWEAWSIAPVKKNWGGVENNLLNHFLHSQLQNNAPYALKLYLK
jgi:hypothetical protein